MDSLPLELGPDQTRAIQRATCAVARSLARAYGQRKFFALSQVHACCADVAAELQPWVYAVFTTRADFEAWIALRDAPATYEQMRAALSRPEPPVVVDEWVPPGLSGCEFDDDDLWWLGWLALRGVLS